MKRTISVFLIITMLMLVFVSCGKDTGMDKGFTYPIDNDPVYLDTQIAKDNGALTIINNCFEGLVRMGADGKILPGVAESWAISSNGKKYTFNLRKDAQWLVTKSAGKTIGEDYETSFDTKLTAHDFVFALRRALEKNTNAPDAQRLMCIKNAKAVNKGEAKSSTLGVKAKDDYTLVINLEYPDDDFLYTLTTSICMPCDEEFFEMTSGRYGLSTAYLIYNGPFYISSWNEDTSISLKRNEKYAGEYKSTAASVYLSVNNEISSRGSKLSQGTYDITPLAFEQYGEVSGSKKLSFAEKADTVRGLIFNCSDKYMSNLKARLAICYGFDTSLMEAGEYTVGKAKGIVPSACLNASVSYREKASDVQKLRYNNKKAEGYWTDALKALNEKGMTITIKCSYEHENQLRAAIQNLQKTFGISCDARVSPMEEQALLDDIRSGNYQIAYAPVKAQKDLAADFLADNVTQLTRYENKEYTSLINKVRNASGNDRLNGLARAEEFLINNGVILPVFEEKTFYGTAEGVENIQLSACGNVVSFYNAIKYE